MIAAVRYDGYEMPPKRKLPDGEIALLEKWVSLGAPDLREPQEVKADPEKLWALQPIQKPAIPAGKHTGWARDEIDDFILARLEQEGLEPARDARVCAHFGVPWRFGHNDVMSCSVRQRIGIAAVIVTRRSSWLIKNCRTSIA